MNYTYKLYNVPTEFKGMVMESIIRKEDGAMIPKDEANTDYQEYLEWVAEGNTAEAAD
tara:strand:+ start:349 stop:522 length:174 start_codon:yes stop_codon:yes gene_type:complete